MNITLNLTPDQINICLTALHQGPYNQVSAVIDSINSQLKTHIKSMQKDKEVLADSKNIEATQ